jgi:hypothetical protein
MQMEKECFGDVQMDIFMILSCFHTLLLELFIHSYLHFGIRVHGVANSHISPTIAQRGNVSIHVHVAVNMSSDNLARAEEPQGKRRVSHMFVERAIELI